jgi:hypothetical protein
LRGSRRSVTAAAAVGWCAFGRKPAGFSVGVERHGPPPERPVALLLSSCTSGAYVLDAVHSRGVSARQRAGSCWWANEACAAACEEGRAVVAGPWARGPMLSDQRQAVTTTLSRARRPCLRTAASKPAQRESTSTYKGVRPTRMFAPHAPTTATYQLDQVMLNYISAEWGSAVRSTIPRRSIARTDIGAQLKDRQALPRALDSRGTDYKRRWCHPLPRKRLVRGEYQRTRHACSLVVFSAYRRHTQRARRHA